jgi:histidine triad (HIT) family protein
MPDPSCVFCKIVTGEIPSLKLFEDEHTFVFLDIGPLSDGHTLIIPKEHYERLEDMPPETVAAVTRHLPALGRAVSKAVGSEGWKLLQNSGRVAGQVGMHVHFHIIPRVQDDGLGYRWNASEYAQGREQEVQESILQALAKQS